MKVAWLIPSIAWCNHDSFWSLSGPAFFRQELVESKSQAAQSYAAEQAKLSWWVDFKVVNLHRIEGPLCAWDRLRDGLCQGHTSTSLISCTLFNVWRFNLDGSRQWVAPCPVSLCLGSPWQVLVRSLCIPCPVIVHALLEYSNIFESTNLERSSLAPCPISMPLVRANSLGHLGIISWGEEANRKKRCDQPTG